MAETVKTRIEELVGDEARVIDGDFERELYSMDIGEVPFAKQLFDTTPELVIMPKSVAALKKIVRFANAEEVALFPRGSASSGLGGVVPTVKGIVLDLSSLNKIVELNREKETIKVQTGVRWSAIEDFLCPETLALRAYPSSFFSSVGGWIATGGYGIGSYRFGHLKDQIESIEVMFPSGEVKSINSKEKEFARFFGTEGQFGIVLSAVLKLRKKPEKSLPHLIYLESAEDAFVFITGLINAELKPNHIKYMDASHLEEANTFWGEHLFRLKDAVLVEFEEEEEATKFRDFAEGRGILADDYLSNYLWHERLFPMKKRSDKPTPLACEMVIPIANAVSYLKEAKIFLKRCGLDVEVESHIVGKDRALLMLSYMSDVRVPKTYLTHMALIPVLTRLGLKFGGVPYGIGIWNTPFINDKYDTKTLELYRAYKKEVDPNNILNPNKFFAVKTKMSNIPGILFKTRIFRPLIRISATVTPILGKLASSKGGLKEESVLEKIVYSCIKCGSCAAVCPAYLVTNEESVLPKNKLYLAKKLLAGDVISKTDSDKIFLCTHCEMCRDVCQNDLDLVTAWTELEKLLESQFGTPEEAITEFVSTLESSEDYWRFVYKPFFQKESFTKEIVNTDILSFYGG
ncbi:FAD/FMN-containing dehydrogenase [Candidatus Methanophagaceae archaeon]|nr:FAD/FMN-containing dehydrogenase [Methanophagales archaeon]